MPLFTSVWVLCLGLQRDSSRQMALQPASMPRRMRARFATSENGVTACSEAGHALRRYTHLSAWRSVRVPVVVGQWGIVEGLIDRTGLPVIIPDYPLAPPSTPRPKAFDCPAHRRRAQAEFGRVVIFGDSGGWRPGAVPRHRSDATRTNVRWTASSWPRAVGGCDHDEPEIEGCSSATRSCVCPGWRGRAARGLATWIRPTGGPLYGDPAGLPPMRISRGRGHRWPRRDRVRAQGPLALAWTCAVWSRMVSTYVLGVRAEPPSFSALHLGGSSPRRETTRFMRRFTASLIEDDSCRQPRGTDTTSQKSTPGVGWARRRA